MPLIYILYQAGMATQQINLPPKLRVFAQKSRYKVAYGGRGGAKSWSIAQLLVTMAASRPLRILCAREFQVSIGESVHKLISDQIERLGLSYLFDVGKIKITSVCGSEFIFAGIRNNPTKIKSTEGVDICWLEEADNISQTSWEVLIPTIRKHGSEIWVSFNPKDDSDPTFQRFIVHPPPDAAVVKINWDDNPWFPEELRKEKDYLYSVDPEAAAHVWGGECRTNSDAQVLKGKCIVEGFEPELLWNGPYYGADWGFSVDPTAAVKCWIFDGVLYVEEEAYGVGVEIDHLPRLFDSVSGMREHVCRADNARPETISYMQRNGYPRMIAVEKWGGCVEDSVETLRSFRQIVIHPRCKHMEQESRLWSYKTDRVTGDILPVLAGGNDHCIAHGEIIDTLRGKVEIQNVTTNDFVLTRNGYRRVLFSGCTGINQPLIEIKTATKRLLCTSEHLVFVIGRGFVKADTIRYNDRLILLKDGGNKSWSKHLTTMAKSLEDTLKATGVLMRYISRNPLLKEAITFIGEYGKIISEQYQKAFTSIISTETHQTTAFQTLSALVRTITYRITGEIPQKKQSRKEKPISIISGILQRLGTHRLKASRSTGKSALLHIRALFQQKKNAFIVNQNSLQKRLGIKTYFVATNANQHIDELLALMTSLKNALNAAMNLPQTSIRKIALAEESVVLVRQAEQEANVYDLTIDKDHEFFANGILVHNCVDALRYAINPIVRRREAHSEVFEGFM